MQNREDACLTDSVLFGKRRLTARVTLCSHGAKSVWSEGAAVRNTVTNKVINYAEGLNNYFRAQIELMPIKSN